MSEHTIFTNGSYSYLGPSTSPQLIRKGTKVSKPRTDGPRRIGLNGEEVYSHPEKRRSGFPIGIIVITARGEVAVITGYGADQKIRTPCGEDKAFPSPSRKRI